MARWTLRRAVAQVAAKTASSPDFTLAEDGWSSMWGDPASTPAVDGILRLLANAGAAIEFSVVDEAGLPARGSELGALLANPHRAVSGAWEWRADLAMSFARYNEALLHILRVGSRVIGLRVVPIEQAQPIWENGGVTWIDTSRASPLRILPRDAIFMRGANAKRAENGLGGLRRGLSPLHTLRDVTAAEDARQAYAAQHAASGMQPAYGYQFPTGTTPDQASEWIDATERRHAGRKRWGRILAVGNGAQIISIPPSSARDAQAAEQTALTLAQAAWEWDVPPSIAGVQGAQIDSVGGDWRRFVTLCAAPPMLAIASALQTRLAAPGERIRLVTEGLMHHDPLVAAQVRHTDVQSGVLLPDEARADMGRGPLPAYTPTPLGGTIQAPGSVPQMTPVGGAPNPNLGGLPA